MHEEHSYILQKEFLDFRLYDKLLPEIDDDYDKINVKTDDENHNKLKQLNAIKKKRGRRSKDEQLAWEHSLPATAEEITRMSHAAIQQLMREVSLSSAQKQLIKKIRRRGLKFFFIKLYLFLYDFRS